MNVKYITQTSEVKVKYMIKKHQMGRSNTQLKHRKCSSSSSRVYFNCTTYIHVYIIGYESSSELIITIIKQAVHFTILLYNLVLAWLFSRLPARP